MNININSAREHIVETIFCQINKASIVTKIHNT